MPLKHRDTALVGALGVLIIVGMVLAYSPIYTCSLSVTESEGVVQYEYDANYGVETHTALIHTDGGFRLSYIAAYYDEGYVAINPWSMQLEFFNDMEKQLQIRSFYGFGLHDSQSLLEVIETYDPSETAIFIVAGALSDVLYDGTADCPLIQWLERGGTIISMSQCLGKYVSHGPDSEDLQEVEGYAELFTGVEGIDDLAFMDSPRAVYTSAVQHPEFQDALGLYLNEYTYGIDRTLLTDCLSVGNETADGYTSGLYFKSYNGMVINFGMSLSIHPHTGHFVAQALAAGLDYTAEIVEVQHGNTYGDASGTFVVEGDGYHIYGYAGATRAVYGDRVYV